MSSLLGVSLEPWVAAYHVFVRTKTAPSWMARERGSQEYARASFSTFVALYDTVALRWRFIVSTVTTILAAFLALPQPVKWHGRWAFRIIMYEI